MTPASTRRAPESVPIPKRRRRTALRYRTVARRPERRPPSASDSRAPVPARPRASGRPRCPAASGPAPRDTAVDGLGVVSSTLANSRAWLLADTPAPVQGSAAGRTGPSGRGAAEAPHVSESARLASCSARYQSSLTSVGAVGDHRPVVEARLAPTGRDSSQFGFVRKGGSAPRAGRRIGPDGLSVSFPSAHSAHPRDGPQAPSMGRRTRPMSTGSSPHS
jgi:hypothetical protein